MGNPIIGRLTSLQSTRGCSQASFARQCGIGVGNLNKMLKGKETITDSTLHRIADTFGVNFYWLRDGIGEMWARERREGEENYRELAELQDKALGGVSVNTIHGDNNSGTQTIGAPDATREEVAALKAKVAMLEKIIEDKNGYIGFLQSVITQKNNLQ